ncbi:YitT family protein [Metabacillus litoralis]|uniref:YitT family protein n=1 Tax=Metabacillus TaxID=2675233 RepID=UPI000EF5D8ED|nr:YitT family protein [Metabacillus litoralis]MCM3163082.1 YitT family protein [Metabacillus litoralis]MCM3410788.1 YitT family protein [Metabacillus litoralis]
MLHDLRLKNIIFILIGSGIFGFGLVHFNIQNNLAEGGFTGITLLLYFLFNFDPSISNLILNIPLFIIGWRVLGKTSFIYTVIGTVSLSVFLWIFQRFQINMPLNDDLTLAALFAGVSLGIGLGTIFRYGGTTGGVDIIARLAHRYIGWSMGKTMFLFDLCVITISWIAYLSYKEAMYTLVAVFVGARVIDFMQEGAYAAKGATIISNYPDEISSRIMKEMDRGVTILKGQGSFSKQDRNVLYCVVGKNEIVRLKNVITSVDPHAFVAVSDVHDVLGEGFTLDENKKPISR